MRIKSKSGEVWKERKRVTREMLPGLLRQSLCAFPEDTGFFCAIDVNTPIAVWMVPLPDP